MRVREFSIVAVSCCLPLVTACGGAEPPLLGPGPTLKIPPGNVVAADVNGDRRDDLIISGGQTLHVMISSAAGEFTPAPRPTPPLAERVHEMEAGDVNGDGKLDVVTADHDSYAVSVLLGDGAGSFAPAQGSPLRAREEGKRPHTHALALADVDRDGKLDVITANSEDNDISVLLGDGAGRLAIAPRSPFPCGASPYPVALADLDGDSFVDVLVPNTGSATLTVLRGDGKGGFAPHQAIKTANRPFCVSAGDFTGDAKPDAIVTHDDARRATVLRNDGTGRLAAAPDASLDLGSSAWETALRDMNDDGKTDLVAAAKDHVRVLLGDGSGGFAPAPGSPFPTGRGTWRLAIGDFNADGKPDVAATCLEDERVAVLLGR
jgi:hypothetical protein